MITPLVAAAVAAQATPAKPVLPPGLFAKAVEGATVEQVTLYPIYGQPFMCGEHPSGQLTETGDALGTDCQITGGLTGPRTGFMSFYKGDGSKVTDWYGWRASVHAPMTGTVRFVYLNPLTNTPGTMGKPPASMILIAAADGTDVVLAHIQEPRVKAGDHVTAGQVIALVGDNGMARNPHIHIGAYRGTTPLQIRWDSRAMGKVLNDE